MTTGMDDRATLQRLTDKDIDAFRFTVKFVDGNRELEAEPAG